MIRALWLSGEKPPKQLTLEGDAITIVAIKNDTLQARLIPEAPEAMTVKNVMEWAELVRRVTTGYGANAVLIHGALALDPIALTLRQTLSPYRISLRIIN